MPFLQLAFGDDVLLQHQVRWHPSPEVPRRSCQVALNKMGASDVITWVQWQWWGVQQVAVRLMVSGETWINHDNPPCKSCHCNRQTILKSLGIDALGVPIRTQQTIDQQEWLWGRNRKKITRKLHPPPVWSRDVARTGHPLHSSILSHQMSVHWNTCAFRKTWLIDGGSKGLRFQYWYGP